MCLVEGVNGTDVAPITLIALGGAGHIVIGEVIDVGLALGHEIRDDVTAHVMGGIRGLLVFLQGLDEVLGGKHIVPHGGVGHIGIVWGARRISGLLQELGDVPIGIGLDTPKRTGFGPGNADTCHGHGLAGGNMLGNHLLGIHSVHVIGTEHNHIVGLLIINQVEGLQKRIGGTQIPVLA